MTFVNRQYLVETDWLADHLDDPDLRIVDCTQYLPDYGEKVEITTVQRPGALRPGPHPRRGLRRPARRAHRPQPAPASTPRCRRPSSSPR